MSTVDLSALPAPQVLEPLDFEALYEEELETFRGYMGDNWSAELESDPVVKLLELSAYRRMQNRARVNDAAKAQLLAYAEEGDLDHLAGNVNLKRLVIQQQDLLAVPPVVEVKEFDDALRERVQLAYPVVHGKLRLALLSLLATVEEAEFTWLRARTGATDGNLGAQLMKLEEAGYVTVEKRFVQRKPQTLYRMTEAGRTALTEYVKALKQLLGSAI